MNTSVTTRFTTMVAAVALLISSSATWAAVTWFEAEVGGHKDPAITYTESTGTGWAHTSAHSAVPVDEVNFPGVKMTSGIGSRYTTNTAAVGTFTFTPIEGGEYEVFVTWGNTTNGDTDVTYTLNYQGGSFAQHFNQVQGVGNNAWNQVGGAGAKYPMNAGVTYTLVATNPATNGAGRLMCDAIAFRKPGCGDVARVSIAIPVMAGDTLVKVGGVDATASAVKVYANGVLVGTNNTPTAGETTVTTTPLPAGQHINATQVIGGNEGCILQDGPLTDQRSQVPAVSVAGAYVPPANTVFASVLLAGDTKVRVSGVRSDAVKVTVYANGVAIGSNNAPAGAANVDVTVTALVGGQVISATQSLPSLSQPAKSLEGEVPATGKTVGAQDQVAAPAIVGMVDAGRTQVRVTGIDGSASSVTVFDETAGSNIGVSNAPTAGTTVVTVSPLVLGHVIKAKQTVRLESALGAGRRVMGAKILEDFEDLAAAQIVGDPPLAGGSFRIWHNVNSVGFCVTTPTVATMSNGSRCIRYEDNGWTNGMYANYEQAIPATGQYHLQVEMEVDEAGAGDLDWLSTFQVGVILNGVDRGNAQNDFIPTIAEYRGSYPCLSPNDDTTGVAVIVYSATFPANAGDNLMLVFATDVSTYSRSKANTGPFSGMKIDNVKLVDTPKPVVCTDVPSPTISPSGANPLEAGAIAVTLSNLDPVADLLTVYANGSPIGTIDPDGASQVDVPVVPLVAGQTITASQTVGGQESCQCPGAVGPVVGTGKNSEVLITLGIRETGAGTCGTTIGCDAGVTGNIEWVGAATTVGGAPQGKSLPASTDWQTVTFAAPAAGGTDPVLSFSAGNGVLDGTWGTLEHIAISTKGENTGRYVMYVDEIYNGTTKVCGFETSEDASMTPGALAMFRPPNNSGSTSANLLGFPMFAEVDGTEAADGTQSYRFEFQFLDNAPKRWVRLTTVDTTASTDMFRQNPMIDLTKPITMKILLFGQPPCGAVFADADDDGDVDMADFAVLQRCMTLEGFEVATECSCFDRPFDGKIGADDLTSFHNCASGPGIPADPACDD